jgi:hypothetical protein
MHNMSSTYSAVSWGNWKQKMELHLAPRGGHMEGLKKNRGWHDGIAPVMSEISVLKIWVWIGLNDAYIGFLWVCLGFHPLANLDAHPSMLRRVRILGYQQAGLEPTLCWKDGICEMKEKLAVSSGWHFEPIIICPLTSFSQVRWKKSSDQPIYTNMISRWILDTFQKSISWLVRRFYHW